MISTAIRLAVLFGLILPAAALAAHSDWVPADRSQLRLLLSGVGEDGRHRAGIEVVLEPGWYTYWRNPGESGIPPRFDFSGSENVASVEVLYPAPERHDDGMSVSVVYSEETVFPLLVTPVDAAKPVMLALEADFGVCNDVCIPTGASVAVEAPSPPEPDPLTEARLASFMARVPGPPEPGRFDIEQAAVDGDAIVVDVRMPDSAYTDLFAAPPAGWYVRQPVFVSRAGGISQYRIELDSGPPDTGIAGAEFRFVAAAGGEAIEKVVAIR